VGGEGGRAGAGRRHHVREATTAAREAARRWGEAGGAGEPPESPEGSARGSGLCREGLFFSTLN